MLIEAIGRVVAEILPFQSETIAKLVFTNSLGIKGLKVEFVFLSSNLSLSPDLKS